METSMIMSVIEEKVSNLTIKDEFRIMLLNMIGTDSGKMKYVKVEGVPEIKLFGTDTSGYLSALIDTITLYSKVNNNSSKEEKFLMSEKSSNREIMIRGYGFSNISIGSFEEIAESWGISDSEDDNEKDDADGWGDDDEEPQKSEESANDEDNKEEDGNSDDEEEDDEVNKEVSDSEKGIRKAIEEWVGRKLNPMIDMVLSAYAQVLASGFDLQRPYGVVTDGNIGYIRNNDSNRGIIAFREGENDLDKSTKVQLGDLFTNVTGCAVSDSVLYSDIANDIFECYTACGKSKYVYFYNKIIAYAYGRKVVKSKDGNIYFDYCKVNEDGRKVSISNNWSKYLNEYIRKDITLAMKDSAYVYCTSALGLKGKSYKEADNVLKSKYNELLDYLRYVAGSLSLCFVILDFKCINENPVSIRLRVCDSSKKFAKVSKDTIIGIVAEGNTGGTGSYSSGSSLNTTDSELVGVYELNHEFNHKLANGLPLFAYKALETIKSQGDEISFDSLILGQSDDGTILRNNTHGLKLGNSLFHYIIAGSRSGKGVMTLNLIVGALLSNKAVFYLDNKPDMASMLSLLAGGNTNLGPKMFAVQGQNWEDDRQLQFKPYCDGWINRKNIPIEAVSLFGEPKWEGDYGVIFYLRALSLVMGIIFARGRDGGSGHSSDPEFNGSNGIFLICDEINKLQDGFLEEGRTMSKLVTNMPPIQRTYTDCIQKLESSYDSANSEDAKKSDVDKFKSAKADVETCLSAAGFYAVSMINMLKDNIGYINGKSKAGFLPKEKSLSDIVVIGQELERAPIGLSELGSITVSGRLAAKVKGATKAAIDIATIDYSVPMSHFVFSSSDAIIGYNIDHRSYLAQESPTSRAYKKLDEDASNFCYLPSLNIEYGKAPAKILTEGKANKSENVYFKPYLILNDCDEDNSSESGYVNQMLERVSKAGITKEEMLAAYGDGNGHFNKAIGMPEYLAMLGVNDIPERLQRGAKIADLVLSKYVGYQDDGSGRPLWLQFVTDLRPEWMLSITDIVGMCCNDTTNVQKGRTNPILKEYYSYVDFVNSHSEYGIVDNTMSRDGAVYTDENGEVQYDVSGYESNSRQDFEAEDDDYGDYSEQSQQARMDNVFNDSESEDGKDTEDDDSFDLDIFETNENEGQSGNIKSKVSEGESNVNTNSKEIAQMISFLIENGYISQSEYKINPAVNGVDCGYQRTDNVAEFSGSEFDSFEQNSEGELTADSMADLMYLVTKRVDKEFGGLSRVTSLEVVGGALVVNGTVFRTKISKDCIGKLPLDIRRKINSGNLADLFNFAVLKKMKSLRTLKFDSKDFIYEIVGEELGYGNTLGVNNFFDDVKSLQTLIIGKERFTRDTYKDDMKKSDTFYYQSKSSKVSNWCNNFLSKRTKKSWAFTKNCFNNKNHGLFTKTLGVVFGTAITAAVGTMAVGAKAVDAVNRTTDRGARVNSDGKVKRGLGAFARGVKDLFSE